MTLIFSCKVMREARHFDDLIYRRRLERAAARKERMSRFHKLRPLLGLVFFNRRHVFTSELTAGHFLLREILYYKNDR